ncbi:hypothetical protein CDAR_290801 [Caerostris darwini]|uniref:Uncharacterized protein n=1 Tax=Caerostris darwini TaxID=1538125 RepID=A0AAV4VNV7_9ARAC|nr:hypothetical protein CDAR_290801 [Caerostris darwini]
MPCVAEVRDEWTLRTFLFDLIGSLVARDWFFHRPCLLNHRIKFVQPISNTTPLELTKLRLHPVGEIRIVCFPSDPNKNLENPLRKRETIALLKHLATRPLALIESRFSFSTECGNRTFFRDKCAEVRTKQERATSTPDCMQKRQEDSEYDRTQDGLINLYARNSPIGLKIPKEIKFLQQRNVKMVPSF